MQISFKKVPEHYTGDYPSVTITFNEMSRGLAEHLRDVIESELDKFSVKNYYIFNPISKQYEDASEE